MVMEGLVILCAGALLLADPKPAPDTAEERDRQVAATLAVQTALEKGRELIVRGDFKTAVYVLEGQVPHINGNRAYLRTLQDAYRGHIKELRLTKKDADAEIYARRLSILDPGSVLESPPKPASGTVAKATPPAKTNPAPAGADNAAARPPTVRMQGDEQPAGAKTQAAAARELLNQADQEFAQQHYREAGQLYERAHQAEPGVTAASKGRWAYCKLHAVAQQINQKGAEPPRWPDLEREVRAALELAPQLDFGKQLLAEIDKRKAGAGNSGSRWQDLPVQHTPRNAQGWSVAESANFRVLHNQTQELAAQAARIAERTRAEMQAKWFGSADRPWSPKCDVYLHANAQDYHRLTHVPTASPGHSKVEMDSGRLLSRQVHVRCDHPNMLTAVLPHETTHVVLAGGFTDVPIPRWADEGIAVLTEPREQIDRHLRNLSKHYQDGTLFSVRELVEQTYQPQQEKYPEARRIGAFYAQSISLVEFLTNLNGPQTLTAFIRDGLRQGYEPALQRHYGIRDFNDLQQRWMQHAFRTVAASP